MTTFGWIVIGLALLFGGLALVVRSRSWLIKAVAFVLAVLGGAYVLMANMNVPTRAVLFFNVVLFIVVGFMLLKYRSGGGDIALGAFLLLVGIITAPSALNSLGLPISNSVIEGVSPAFGQGWEAFIGVLEGVFVAT